MMKFKKRLGDILVEDDVITSDQLQNALELQKITGGKLGDILIENKLVTEDVLYKVLEDQYGIPYVDLNNIIIDPKIPKLISESIAKKHTLIPIGLEKNVLTVSMSDPLDMIAKDDVRIITGLQVEAVISPSADIIKSIHKH